MGEETLDPLIHTQARLRIMTTLTALPDGDRLTFTKLQSLLDATAGNLSTHLRRLEDAGYVQVVKGHQGRIPSTEVGATRAGRHAFEEYLSHLRALLTPPAGAGVPSTADPASSAVAGAVTSPVQEDR
jgi:DNA-binding transcriptional ArsR family regulator